MPGPITTVREDLAAVLSDAPSLAAFDVLAYPLAVDAPTSFTVVLNTARVTPGPTAAPALLVSVDVWLIAPATDYAETLDALDDAAALVLSALRAAGVEWTTAEPAVWRDTHPAYRIETETLT